MNVLRSERKSFPACLRTHLNDLGVVIFKLITPGQPTSLKGIGVMRNFGSNGFSKMSVFYVLKTHVYCISCIRIIEYPYPWEKYNTYFAIVEWISAQPFKVSNAQLWYKWKIVHHQVASEKHKYMNGTMVHESKVLIDTLGLISIFTLKGL